MLCNDLNAHNIIIFSGYYIWNRCLFQSMSMKQWRWLMDPQVQDTCSNHSESLTSGPGQEQPGMNVNEITLLFDLYALRANANSLATVCIII